MELDTLAQTLQGELRAFANLRKQESEHALIIAGLVSRVIYQLRDNKSAPNSTFLENDYGAIVTMISKNPKFKKKRKWATESWPRYAVRISKWVRWPVDAKVLQTAFDIQETD